LEFLILGTALFGMRNDKNCGKLMAINQTRIMNLNFKLAYF